MTSGILGPDVSISVSRSVFSLWWQGSGGIGGVSERLFLGPLVPAADVEAESVRYVGSALSRASDAITETAGAAALTANKFPRRERCNAVICWPEVDSPIPGDPVTRSFCLGLFRASAGVSRLSVRSILSTLGKLCVRSAVPRIIGLNLVATVTLAGRMSNRDGMRVREKWTMSSGVLSGRDGSLV